MRWEEIPIEKVKAYMVAAGIGKSTKHSGACLGCGQETSWFDIDFAGWYCGPDCWQNELEAYKKADGGAECKD